MAWDLLQGWDRVFADSDKEIAFTIEKASVRASGWAMGRSEDDIDKEAARRLKEEKGIDYKLPEKKR
ncbi:MAG TPA: hypothetical protein P5121_01155 [Caldilineaceae bacterium]|nr:hypothetical protein [Caldilineaceae bacterium]